VTQGQRRALGQILALTALFTVALVLVGRIVDAPPAGGVRLASASLCETAVPCRPVTLPHRFSARPGEDQVRARFRLTIPAAARSGPQAIYLPDFADAVGLTLDGRALAMLPPGPLTAINRNRPAQFTLPEGAIGSGAAE